MFRSDVLLLKHISRHFMTMDACSTTSTKLTADCALWLLFHYASQKVGSKKCDIISPSFVLESDIVVFTYLSLHSS